MTLFRQELIGLSVGLLLGALTSWFAVMPWVEGLVQLQAQIPNSPMIAPCDVRLDPMRARIDALKEQRSIQQAAWNTAQERSLLLDGNGVLWDDNIPKSFNEESVKTLMTSVITSAGARVSLLQLDCTEFPCVSVLEAKRQSELDTMYGTLTERGFEHLETLRRSARRQNGNRRYLMLVAYWPQEMLKKAQRDRIGYRMDALMTPLIVNGGE